MTKFITFSALLLAAVPAFAGPPTGVTTGGTGVAATPWLREQPREVTRYDALTGRRPDRTEGAPKTWVLYRLGNNKVELYQYR